MTPDEQGFSAYWLALRASQRRRRGRPAPPPRRFPSMPKRQWRLWALACIALGALAGSALWAAVGWPILGGAVLGGVIGLVGGMLLVESRWVRRQGEPP